MRAVLALAAGAAFSLVVGGSTAGAVGTTIGQTAPSPGSVSGCGGSGVWVSSTDSAGTAYSTTAGVITSWTIAPVAPNLGQTTLKVMHPGTPGVYTVAGTGTPHLLSGATATNTFPERIPVAAGDRLGFYVWSGFPSVSSCTFATVDASDTVRSAVLAPSDPNPGVGTVISTGPPAPNRRLNVSAVVEPDADVDGYGDVSQDACPSRADRQVECVPPDTTAKAPRRVSTSGAKAKVKVKLSATEAGSTFVCTVDRKVRACSAPRLTLRLKVGKHKISVVAVDPAGNTDPTPAVAVVKVTRERA